MTPDSVCICGHSFRAHTLQWYRCAEWRCACDGFLPQEDQDTTTSPNAGEGES